MYKNLKAFRESLGMTQKEFADTLSIGLTTYNGYETGARDPKSDFWVKVAKKYRITIDYLMGYSNDPHKTSLEVDSSLSFSAEEQKHIKKYRTLDEHGKKTVDLVLDSECERMQKQELITLPVASRGGGVEYIQVTPEQLKQMKDLEKEIDEKVKATGENDFL